MRPCNRAGNFPVQASCTVSESKATAECALTAWCPCARRNSSACEAHLYLATGDRRPCSVACAGLPHSSGEEEPFFAERMLRTHGGTGVGAEWGQQVLDTAVKRAWRRRVSVRAAVTRSPAGQAMGNVMQRQSRGSHALRQAGPALRGFSGDTTATCSPRCSSLYFLALERARCKVMNSPHVQFQTY